MLAGVLASRGFFCCFSSTTVVSAILFKVYFNVRNLAKIRYPFPKSSPFSLLLHGGAGRGGGSVPILGRKTHPPRRERPGSWVRGSSGPTERSGQNCAPSECLRAWHTLLPEASVSCLLPPPLPPLTQAPVPQGQLRRTVSDPWH